MIERSRRVEAVDSDSDTGYLVVELELELEQAIRNGCLLKILVDLRSQ